MENTNKTAYYACHIDNSITGNNYCSFSPVPHKSKSFSFDIWFLIEGTSHTLISQESGFTFGIDEELITFSHPAIGRKSICSEIVKFKKKEWVNIFVTYDSKELSFAINGIVIAQISYSNIAFISTEVMRIGEEFTGYIRSFRLYSETIKNSDFNKYLYQAIYTNANEMPYISAFIDCNTEKMQDLSPNKNNIKLHNACSIVDIVHIYKPSKGKYACLNNAGHINPGAFDSQSFSVYIKTYIRPSSSSVNKKQVLFANGNFDEVDSVVIYTQYESSETFKVGCRIGDKTITSKALVKGYTWADIIVNYSNQTISFLINAEEESYTISQKYVRKSKADVKIGNCFDAGLPQEDFTCGHYISMLGIFSKTLTRKDAENFLENHPFIFEDNLVALYGFDTGIPVESVSCRDLSVDAADLQIAQRTTDLMPKNPYQYRWNYTPKKASSIAIWQAETIYAAYTEYYVGMLNLKPVITGMEKSKVLNYLANESLIIEENMELFVSEKVTGDTVSNSISQLIDRRVSQFNKILRPNTAANATAGGSIAVSSSAAVAASALGIASVSKVTPILYSFGSLAVASVIGVTLLSVLEKIGDKPNDDDDDDSKTPLEITELKLQHNPDNFKESAIRCRTCKGPVTTPEWTQKDKSNAVAIYVSDEITTVKINATVEIKDTSKTPKGTYQVKITAYAKDATNALFNYLEFNGSLSLGINKDVVLIAKKRNFPKDTICKNQMELVWNYEIDGKKNTTYNTKIRLYAIPKPPAFPIELDGKVPERLLYTEFLEFIFETQKPTRDVSDNKKILNATPDDLSSLTDTIYNHPRLTYQAGAFAPFVNIQGIAVNVGGRFIHVQIYAVSVNQMMKALNAPGQPALNIECTMFACILAYFFWASGVQANIVGIQNPNAGQLTTNQIIPSKGVAGQHNFNNHVIVEVHPQPDIALPGISYYDASCKIPGATGPQTLANLAFSNMNGPNVQAGDAGSYRGLFFQMGTPATITIVAGQNPLQIIFV